MMERLVYNNHNRKANTADCSLFRGKDLFQLLDLPDLKLFRNDIYVGDNRIIKIELLVNSKSMAIFIAICDGCHKLSSLNVRCESLMDD